MILTQNGNREADVRVSSAAGMTCTSGSIPLDNTRWSLTDVAYGDAGTTAMTTAAVNTLIDVLPGTNAVPAPTKTLYLNLLIPFGVGGTCTGTTTIDAILH